MTDLRLIHNGTDWVADNDELEIKAKTLEALDNKVRAFFHQKEKDQEAKTTQVRMTFDNFCMPEFLRQYSNHYFNRTVTINSYQKNDDLEKKEMNNHV